MMMVRKAYDEDCGKRVDNHPHQELRPCQWVWCDMVLCDDMRFLEEGAVDTFFLQIEALAPVLKLGVGHVDESSIGRARFSARLRRDGCVQG